MSEIIFSSQFYSLASIDYRVRLYGKTYIGFDAVITGGSGNTFYVAEDWTDYLQGNQALIISSTSSTALDTINIFSYNAALNRTEITVNIETFAAGKLSIKNNSSDAASFIPSFETVIQNLVANYENSDDYILSPLMTSHIDITYANVKQGRTEVDTAFFDRFIELYLQSDDDELRLTLERNDSGYKLEWAGNIVMDLIEWGNDNSPRPYTFRAIDGINRLKNVPYDGDLASLQNKKIKDIIIDVLALNGLDEFWSTSDIYIKDTIEYQSADVVGVNASDSPLDYSYVYENLLIELDGNVGDDYVFRSGYDILYGLMQLFSARLIHSNGFYYIQQIRNYDTTAITTRNYVKAGTYVATTYTHSNDTLRVLAGGKFGYLYGIKRALMETENKDILSLLSSSIYGDVYADFNPADPGKLQMIPTIEQNVGSISGGIAAGQFITVQMKIHTSQPNIADMDFVAIFTVYDATNNRYLQGSDTVAPYWGSGSATASKNYQQTLKLKGGTSPSDEYLSIVTPLIPYELEDVLIKFEIHTPTRRKAPSATEQIFSINNFLIAIPNKNGENLESVYVDNPNVKFTKDLDLGNLIINESTAFAQINNISVDANYNGGAIDYKIGGVWNASFDANYRVTTTRVLEAMSLQYKPLRKYMGDWDGKYHPFQTIPYDNAVFAAKEVTINFLMDNVSGEWFEVVASRVGLTSNVIGKSDVYVEDSLGDAFVQSQNNAIGVGTLEGDLTPNIGITSINLNSTGDIKIGDKIQLLGPSGDVYLELVSTQDLSSTGAGVTLSVVSFDLVNPIPSGTNIVYGYKKMYYSEKLRFDTLQHTAVKTAPTVLPDMLYNEVRVVGPDIWIKSGETIYKLAGVSTIV